MPNQKSDMIRYPAIRLMGKFHTYIFFHIFCDEEMLIESPDQWWPFRVLSSERLYIYTLFAGKNIRPGSSGKYARKQKRQRVWKLLKSVLCWILIIRYCTRACCCNQAEYIWSYCIYCTHEYCTYCRWARTWNIIFHKNVLRSNIAYAWQ